MPILNLLTILKNLLFTDYEAKAYIALLKNSPATGYAVAKNSGVPRTKIYDVLNNMIKRGDVIVSPGNPPFYRALPPKSLITARKEQAQKNFAVAEHLLEQLDISQNDDGDIWNITGRDSILQKVKECINGANRRILLEIWADDFKEIAVELKEAADRGVNVTIVSYGAIAAEFANLYLHDMSDEITEENGGRWLVVSVDDSQVVAGTISMEEKNRAAWTMNPALLMPLTEVIVHDLYIAEILKEHRDVLEKTFGKDLINLRQKFSICLDQKEM